MKTQEFVDTLTLYMQSEYGELDKRYFLRLSFIALDLLNGGERLIEICLRGTSIASLQTIENFVERQSQSLHRREQVDLQHQQQRKL